MGKSVVTRQAIHAAASVLWFSGELAVAVFPSSHAWVGFLAFPLVMDHKTWESGDVASEEGGVLEEEKGSSLGLKDIWPLHAHLFAFPSHPSCI